MKNGPPLLCHGAFVWVATVDLDLKCPFCVFADEEKSSGVLKGRTDASFFLISYEESNSMDLLNGMKVTSSSRPAASKGVSPGSTFPPARKISEFEDHTIE